MAFPMKIRSVGVLSVGKLFAAMYAAFGLLAGLAVGVFAVLGGVIAAQQQGAAAGFPPVALGIAAVFFVPVFYGGIGFVGGLLTAGLYNVAAHFLGGVEVELGE
jgi:hypothetical protein